jgi:phosphate ABC transporter permease protein PstC/phosphate ABC transporter permease subunit PstA
MAPSSPSSTDPKGILARTGADFDRPLLLTPGEDIVGYVAGKAGHALLFLIAAVSVIAVLLIFAFIIQRNELFLTTTGGDHTRSQYSTAATKAILAYEKVLTETGEKARADDARSAFLHRIDNFPSTKEKVDQAYRTLLDVAKTEREIANQAVGADEFAEDRQSYFANQADDAYEAFQAAGENAKPTQARELIDRAADGVARRALYRSGDTEQAQAAADQVIETKADAFYKRILANPPEDASSPQAAAKKAKQDFLNALRPTFVTEAKEVFRREAETLGSKKWYPQAEHSEFGMLPLLYGSFLVTFGSLLVAVPLGITAAVVLSDIVPFQIRQLIKPVVELLAAIPSVAYGFFAIMVVAPWLQREFGLDTGTNALNASLILAVMAIPTIISVAEDALTAMGRDLREASYAMGATRFETLFKVVIPAAHNGIIAAVILGMMRAIGETMVVWMAAGNAAHIPHAWYDLNHVFGNLTEAVRTMTATIAAEMGEAPEGSIHRSALFHVGLLLLVFTFTLNVITEYFVSRFKKGMGQTHKKQARRNLLQRSLQALLGGLRWGMATVVWAFIMTLLIWIVSAVIGLIFGTGQGLGWTAQAWVFAALVGFRLVAKLARQFADADITRLKSAVSSSISRAIDPVRMQLRRGTDRAFTGFAYATVGVVVACLLILLGPIFVRGIGAVIFRETVEHRLFQLQYEPIQRGDRDDVLAEFARCQEVRKPVYHLLDDFAWLNPDRLDNRIGKTCRQAERQLDDVESSMETRINRLSERIGHAERDEKPDRVETLRGNLADLRNRFEQTRKRNETARGGLRRLRRWLSKAYESTDKAEAEKYLKRVLDDTNKDLFKGTAAMELFAMAREYAEDIRDVDLGLRDEPTTVDPSMTYGEAYTDTRDILIGKGAICLLGRQDRQEVAMLPVEIRYGANRWSMVERDFDKLMHATVWLTRRDAQGNILPREETTVDRASLFDKPSIEPFREVFAYTADHLEEMFNPQWTLYWGYFVDPATEGNVLGGVRAEIVGTLLVTVIAVLVALPLGVIAAAYLVEVAGDNLITRAIRMCINTLAGVPSIVFGLFGMVFFLGWFLPAVLGGEAVWGKSTVLAGGLTLALLILPIIIRASEEAIRSVPPMYKEASLGLGAGKLRCFLTVQFPAALPGVLTGTILGMSRAAGETAPLLFTAAVATGGMVSFEGWKFWQVFQQPTQVLSGSAFWLATADRLSEKVPHNQYGMVMTLVLLVLILNFAAILLRSRVSKKLRGG